MADDHPNRCFHNRVGSALQRKINRRKWLKKEQGHHINVLELMGVKFAILTFTKKSLKLNYSCSDRQPGCSIALSYLLKMRGGRGGLKTVRSI